MGSAVRCRFSLGFEMDLVVFVEHVTKKGRSAKPENLPRGSLRVQKCASAVLQNLVAKPWATDALRSENLGRTETTPISRGCFFDLDRRA
jgi:hypothetical protein